MAKAVVRIRAVQVAFGVGVLILLGRAAQIQLVDGADHQAAAGALRTRRIELPAMRGGIYDRNGVLLSSGQEVFRIRLTRAEMSHLDSSASAIASHLGLPLPIVRAQVRRRFGVLRGPFDMAQVQPLRSMPGVHLDREYTRFRPDPDLAVSLVGLPPGIDRPASGIERILDSLLTGTPGSAVVLRDQFGNPYTSPSRLDAFPVPGHDVFLTIDARLQDLIERELAAAINRYDAVGGDIVVINPRSGELLAAASRRRGGAAPAAVFRSAFEPGSTAKLFAAAALLTEGVVAPTDSVWGESGRWVVGSRTLTDSHAEQWMTLSDVIRRSSNIGMAKFVVRLTPEAQYRMLRAFGLGTPTGIEFPGEARGVLPPPHRWSGPSPASLAIGYEVATTMLQLAQAYGAIANDGVMMRPAIIDRVRDADGAIVYRNRPEPVRRVISTEIAAQLRAMLRDVVYDGGTGESAALYSYEVAGKTGTARRYATEEGYIPGSYTASFASLFPADDPQLVLVVKLDDPEGAYARLSAAPVTKAVLERILAASGTTIDTDRLTGRPQAPDRTPAVADGAAPYVFSWPLDSHPKTERTVTMPDLQGATIREAVRALHQLGLRTVVNGWGSVQRLDPSAGSSVAAGDLVRIVAGERE